jgi:hypothetical protein
MSKSILKNKSNDKSIQNVKAVWIEFPEQFREVHSFQKNNEIYINRLYSEPFCELQYMPQVRE